MKYPHPLQQFAPGTDGTGFGAQNSAEETLHSSTLSWPEAGGTSSVVAASHLRAETLQFVRTESGPTGATNVQTQIAARSAQFGGAVTVEGNLNAKGTVRLLPAGDLSMGAFHKGTKPDGTIDSGN